MLDFGTPLPPGFTERYLGEFKLLTQLRERIEYISQLLRDEPAHTLARRLVYRDASGACRSVELCGPVTLGRSRTSDLVIDCPKVSRLHCRISPRPLGAWVEDLDSSNGTYVNGSLVQSNFLASGDLLDLGAGGARVVFLFDADLEPIRKDLRTSGLG